ncbi:MAG: acyltransferase [Candidatus Korobacteraceae bacterium]|jgi:peptidoglycan/LPS O-acetylase OafA/YrhL
MASPRFVSGRTIDSLDGIRGLAIALVLLAHYSGSFPDVSEGISAAKVVASYGWAGVDLFFALSGFLITGILLDTSDAPNYFRSFYVRRVLRIFPLYYLTLAAVLVGFSFVHPYPAELPLPEDRKLYFVYLTNWVGLWKGAWGENYLGHLWSLAVEEQFYFVWPLCIWFVRPTMLRKTLITGGLFLALGVRVLWLHQTGVTPALRLATITRMDGLLVGALCALLFRQRISSFLARSLPWFAVTLWAVFGVAVFLLRAMPEKVDAFVCTIGFTLLALAFGALILSAAVTDGERTPLQRLLCAGPLKTLGKYSYGIYIFHVPVLGVSVLYMRSHGFVPYGVFLIFNLVTTFLISAISYEYFERRILALKHYFQPAPAPEPSMEFARPGSRRVCPVK